ncbi:non-ribosomal peptide synthetase [Actinophytocola algeriensis]|uniref:Amino acid adenylation domain-containing protein n=1 Tax=Actinophytocola algeriensis TaxID=1768010 RepID=A0A7W7QGC7_9PSEU|nr:non-ribosomal peptide synthetase [Actinophytocola algeriensis]MBB4912874.1 amino acid adenylation domain-containing protein [Actinophytocola algeriensis]MBE1474071.1 amino acid adenylation domain-containing protein [Actinophytocola algeriensis]
MTDTLPHYDRVDTIVGRVATANPDKVAVSDAGGDLTYGELWAGAGDLAASLRAWGVEPGDAVALYAQSSREAITAMLGVLVAGAFYVPIDPTFPDERTRWQVAASGAKLLLCADDHRPASDMGVPLRRVADVEPGADAVAPTGSPESVIYMMFTSGSTGTPKPVAVPHGGITALLLRPSPLRTEATDGMLAGATLAFDTSVLEIWSSLLVGASIVCARGSSTTLGDLAAILAEPRITAAHLSPALFALLVDNYPDVFGGLRMVGCGGDVMPTTQTTRVRTEHPGLRLINSYGPTEACVASTVCEVSTWDETESATVPIGVPLSGARCYVLGEDLRPVADGVPGELFVGGDRLAIGYHNDPELTASRFLDDPFSEVPGARMYRTGDRVRTLPSGALEFLGRTDAEVKIRGYRVNLTESQVVLAADPEVAEAVVVAVGDPGARSLIGFVRPGTAGLDADALRERSWERAPRHVVPDKILVVDTYPTGPTGKVDKRALVALWDERHPVAPAADPATDNAAGYAAVLAGLWTTLAGQPPAPGKDFFHCGGSSLGLIQLIEEVSTRFGVELDFAAVYGMRSFDELLDLVRPAFPAHANA